MTSPTGYSRLPSTAGQQQIVSIQAIDTVNMTASGYTRQNSYLSIDLRYHVGAVHVVPAVFEQWIVRRFGMNWILVSKLPFNTTDLLTDAVPGQVQIGSTGPAQGPLQLNGSVVAANAPLQLDGSATSERPTASTAGAGALIFDTDLHAPIYSDGSVWTEVGSGVGGGSTTQIFGETPAGTFNGINVTFTTALAFQTGTTAVYRNGLREQLGVGYTESLSSTLTFTTAPLADDVITVDYIKQ